MDFVGLKLFLKLFIISLSIAISYGSTFDGAQVLRVFVAEPDQLSFLRKLENEIGGLDFWTELSSLRPVDIMARGQELENLKELLTLHKIQFNVSIDNLDDLIAEQQEKRMEKFAQMNLNGVRFDFEEYYPLAEIQSWLNDLAQANPDLVEIIQIGKSTEGRDVTVAKISTGPNDDGSKKLAIFITATIHAREWISTTTALYAINQLATNSDAHQDILNRADFYVLPVINPDGYSFSHENDRLWRKTRSDHDSPLGCLGVDANRNFGFKWGEAPGGSSTNKCSETYRGPEPFSEPEVAAIRDFVANNAQDINWTVYITLHSYGQYFMCPWGYTEELPQNYQSMKQLSDDASAALRALYGTVYETGSSANVLYFTDGTDQDWALGSGYFPYTYTMEMRDKGQYGFVLPPSQIVPTGEETFEAIKVVARDVQL